MQHGTVDCIQSSTVGRSAVRIGMNKYASSLFELGIQAGCTYDLNNEGTGGSWLLAVVQKCGQRFRATVMAIAVKFLISVREVLQTLRT